MAKHTFNVLGSRFFKDALAGCDSVEVKGSVTGINPACISQGEMETLSSDKGDWIFIDTAYISCGANGEDSASDIDALARFLKKGWGRKIIVAIARPSAYRMGESALYPIRCRHDPATEALAAKLAESSRATSPRSTTFPASRTTSAASFQSSPRNTTGMLSMRSRSDAPPRLAGFWRTPRQGPARSRRHTGRP